jgi:hypothetical protein
LIERSKKEFLEGEPKAVDSGLKNNEHVKKILAKWGK